MKFVRFEAVGNSSGGSEISVTLSGSIRTKKYQLVLFVDFVSSKGARLSSSAFMICVCVYVYIYIYIYMFSLFRFWTTKLLMLLRRVSAQAHSIVCPEILL